MCRIDDRVVALSQIEGDAHGYTSQDPSLTLPEFTRAPASTTALGALRKLFQIWNLDEGRRGQSNWNPLGEFIRQGSRVAIKPNWVYHTPREPATLDSLITHTSVIQAVVEYVALAKPDSVIVGDAPLQGCDFDALRDAAGLDSLESRARDLGLALEIHDFRRTINVSGRAAGERHEKVRSIDRFVEFDLGNDSCLQPLDADADRFRVTVYNPDLLKATHRPGSHKYLIARELLEADVVVNMPKLKCHMKSCITGSLKNLVGINGHKEYLPHHRKGGSNNGGDCYPGAPTWKRVAEDVADFVNRDQGFRPLRYGLGRAAAVGRKLAALAGADDNIEGAWYGNDTIWRTCIDLNRILMYGGTDGRLHLDHQRKIVSITDAIIAGEGEGPLRPTPIHSGFLTGATNPAAAEYVHSRLMGFDPNLIPLVHGAFESGPWPLVDFPPTEIRVLSNGGETQGAQVLPIRHFVPPSGWLGHCELQKSE